MTTLETKAPSTNWRRDLIVDGRRLALLDTGEHDRTCVLVHGLAASWDYWRLTIPALTASHRVVAVDLPGFGYSEDRGRYGPDELVKVLIELVNQERIDTVDLIGHSMGTVVVSEFAARYPDRVDRLVLTGGPIISVLDRDVSSSNSCEFLDIANGRDGVAFTCDDQCRTRDVYQCIAEVVTPPPPAVKCGKYRACANAAQYPSKYIVIDALRMRHVGAERGPTRPATAHN